MEGRAHFGDFFGDYAACEALEDGCLTHAGGADEDRVRLCAAGEDCENC